ncbi:MAG: FtsX-like permease family protein [Muribaculaceae bacterium]|nr:FtsX-like permease family protein [Muribaculaceae bacterium]
MKLVIKNILAHRRRNIWLFLELVVVTIVTWIALDPVMILYSISTLSSGYDYEQLVYMETGVESSMSPYYSESASSDEEMRKSFDMILSQIRNMPDVESVTPVSSWLRLETGSSMPLSLNYLDEQGDTVKYTTFMYGRPIEKDYFITYGIQSTDESPSPQELSDMPMGKHDIIINESVARKMFGDGGNYIGRQTIDAGDGNSYRVVGVVKDVRPWHWRSLWRILWIDEQYTNSEPAVTSRGLIIRLKEGISPTWWINKYKEQCLTDLKAGNLRITIAETNSDMSESTWQSRQAKNNRITNIGLFVFFMVNLILGVAGTFYLQTRRRSHDAGIMKSFGATRRNVFNGLAVEALIITFAGWVIGCLIYLHYALKAGLSLGIDWDLADLPLNHWTSNFWEHFGIVSVAVLVVLAVIVLIGVSFPARRIARVNPVDALRDE